MKACVITIGNEILKGRTVNSNAAHIGKFLTSRGFEVERGLIVKDDADEIAWAIRLCIGKYDLVVTTGGLGPTFDDMTVESIAKALKLELIEDPETRDILLKRYRKLKAEMTPARMKLALIPEGSRAIANRVGAAPGVLLQSGRSAILVLPGVPREMEVILEDSVQLIGSSDMFYAEANKRLEGVMESAIVPIVNSIMDKYRGQVYIKSHPLRSETNEPEIEVEVSAYGKSQEEADSVVKDAFSELLGKADQLKK